jgi:hypothetical protein
MQPVAPPTHVGDLHWPVLSAVRVEGGDHPAEFVVLVDCGEPAPREPYATLLVHVWAEHSKAEQGEYDLTFTQAKRSLAERAGLLPTTTVEVLIVRDPDQANDHTIVVDGHHRPDGKTDTVRVVTHDIDLGAIQITPAWIAEHLQRADDTLSPAAARHAREVVVGNAEDLESLEAEA